MFEGEKQQTKTLDTSFKNTSAFLECSVALTLLRVENPNTYNFNTIY